MPAKTVETLLAKLKNLNDADEKQKCISEFMIAHQGKMPFVETKENGEVEATFLYMGDSKTENVTLLAGFAGYHLGDANRMHRVEDTALFFRSYKLSPDAQGFTYQFAVNLNDNQIKIGADSIQLNYQHKLFENNLKADAFNQRKYKSGNAGFSYFEVKSAAYKEKEMQALNSTRREALQAHTIDALRGYRVLLPENYDQKRAKKYPVYLFADGELSFNLLNPYAALKEAGQEDVVIVLLDTKNRIQDYLFNVNDYIETIVKQIVPQLKERYNASTDFRDYYGVGSSLGAYMMLRLAIAHPEIVGNVLSQSANLGFVDKEHDFRLINFLEALNSQQLDALKKVCFRATVGTYEDVCYSEGDDILSANRQLNEKAKQMGLSIDYRETQAAHDYIPTWRNSLPQDIALLAEKRAKVSNLENPPEEAKKRSVRVLVKQYQSYIDQEKLEITKAKIGAKQEVKITQAVETKPKRKKPGVN